MLGATLLFMFGKRLSTSTGGFDCRRRFHLGAGHRNGVRTDRCSLWRLFRRGRWHPESRHAAALGMTDIHAMNALKVVLGGIINGVAVITSSSPCGRVETGLRHDRRSTLRRILRRPLRSKASWRVIRAFVIAVGMAMTVYFFWKGYH